MYKKEEIDALGLLSQNMEVDEIIELGNKSIIEAIAITENTLKTTISNKIWFKFDLASQGGGHTLFHPIGSYLRDKLKAGTIIRAMPSQNGGWIVRIKN